MRQTPAWGRQTRQMLASVRGRRRPMNRSASVWGLLTRRADWGWWGRQTKTLCLGWLMGAGGRVTPAPTQRVHPGAAHPWLWQGPQLGRRAPQTLPLCMRCRWAPLVQALSDVAGRGASHALVLMGLMG